MTFYLERDYNRKGLSATLKQYQGLEVTGHYSYNLLGFLLDKGLPTYVINPLYTNLYRKSLSLRKTKTGKANFYTIATMMMSNMNLVRERANPKSSVSRFVCILFPELEKPGSKYLRYTLYNTAKCVCHWDEFFGAYLEKNAQKESIIMLRYPTPQKTCTVNFRNKKKSERTYLSAA